MTGWTSSRINVVGILEIWRMFRRITTNPSAKPYRIRVSKEGAVDGAVAALMSRSFLDDRGRDRS
jgi:hypothetical protein